MIRALWTAATGMSAQQLNIDTIANNLANVSTNGYKTMRLEFDDLLYQNMRTVGNAAYEGQELPTGLQIGLGTRPVATTKIFTQGDLQQTGNPLDLTIQGDGFFQVQLPDGTTAYTRDGAFKMDSNGQIVSSDGYIMQPAITIPNGAQSITVGTDGTVSALLSGQTTSQTLGKIELANFSNPAGLSNYGQGLYQPSSASGDPTTGTPGTSGLGTIQQGFLEMSNVQVVSEMVNMIVAQRAYEINSKAVQAADEMLQTADNLKR